jgi:hypothetical protein
LTVELISLLVISGDLPTHVLVFKSTGFYGVFRNHGVSLVWIEHFLNLYLEKKLSTIHILSKNSFKTLPRNHTLGDNGEKEITLAFV